MTPANSDEHPALPGPGPYPLWARLALVLVCCSLQQPPAPRRGRRLPCGGVPPRVPAAGVSLVPRPFSYPFASPSLPEDFTEIGRSARRLISTSPGCTCNPRSESGIGPVPLWLAAYVVWLVLPPQPLRCAAAAAAGWPGEALCAPPLCRLAQPARYHAAAPTARPCE